MKHSLREAGKRETENCGEGALPLLCVALGRARDLGEMRTGCDARRMAAEGVEKVQLMLIWPIPMA